MAKQVAKFFRWIMGKIRMRPQEQTRQEKTTTNAEQNVQTHHGSNEF